MDWAADIALRPRRLLLVVAYGAALVVLTPTVRANQWAFVPLLAGIALAGTVLYVRRGVFVLTAPCEECGERAFVGALRCRQLSTVRTAFSRPLLQVVAAVALFLLVGAAAGLFRTILLWAAAPAGPVWEYLLSDGYGLFRAYFLVSAMVVSVPVPMIVGNLLRVLLRARTVDTEPTG